MKKYSAEMNAWNNGGDNITLLNIEKFKKKKCVIHDIMNQFDYGVCEV